jgi:hypothetical protein
MYHSAHDASLPIQCAEEGGSLSAEMLFELFRPGPSGSTTQNNFVELKVEKIKWRPSYFLEMDITFLYN